MMKTLYLPVVILFMSFFPLSVFSQNQAPDVSEVTVTQRTDGSYLVDISYTVNDADDDSVYITIEASADSGLTWTLPIHSVTGDVNKTVAPGNEKNIVWDFATDHPDTFGTGYRIKIIANDWSQMPEVPHNPKPEDGATNQQTSLVLSWSSKPSDADSLVYHLKFSLQSVPLEPLAITIDTFYQVHNLQTNTQYQWKVIAISQKGDSAAGPVWTFSTENTPPSAPAHPTPFNEEQGVSVSPSLSWYSSDPDGDSLTFDLYIGTDSLSLNLEASDLPDSSYQLMDLGPGTPYFWQVVAKDGKGGETTGAVWRFTTESDTTGGTLTYNGFTYTTVIIGNQEWTVENLRTTQYNDGTDILPITDNGEWTTTTNGAYSAYNNDENNVETYGYLYNWYAVNTGKLAPAGWRVPSDEDWKTLEKHLGMSETEANDTGWRGTDEGGKLKEVGTAHWSSPNWGATNSSGFSALPGGYRDSNFGVFLNIGYVGYWWSATAYGSNAWYRSLSSNSSDVGRVDGHERLGFSVRLVRDVGFDEENTPPSAPTHPTPFNEEQGVSVSPSLSWYSSDPDGDSLTFDLYVGTDSLSLNLEASDLPDSSYQLMDLGPGTPYFWQVVAKDGKGGETAGSIWQFTTASESTPGQLTYNGFTYTTVIIGNQEWTVENLRTTQYNDGTDILPITDNGEWTTTTNGAYSAYNNDENNVSTYGYLYNWYAVDTGKLAPSTGGWRVPSDEDWEALVTAVGGSSGGGTKLKATSGWSNNGNGTDDYGFSALPGGYRSSNNGGFSSIGSNGFWWSASANGTYAWRRDLYFNDSRVFRLSGDKRRGFSVRLVRDVGFDEENTPPSAPTHPTPFNEEQGVSVSPSLSWYSSDPDGDSLTFDLYVGTDSLSLNLEASDLPDSSYQLMDLGPGTPYFWQVVAKDGKGGETTGSIWQFTTASESTPGQLTYNGFTYTTVIIGNQEWTVENLRTTQYNDGTDILPITDNGEWTTTTNGAYSAYNNDENNVSTYGYLYNWYAVNTGKLAPAGWRVPSDEDWKTLEKHLGMSETEANDISLRGTDEGGKLKEVGTAHWSSPNTGATNSSGFSALPGGNRSSLNGYFYSIGSFGYWWSATANGTDAWGRSLFYNYSDVHRYYYGKRDGFSVRLVRDVN